MYIYTKDQLLNLSNFSRLERSGQHLQFFSIDNKLAIDIVCKNGTEARAIILEIVDFMNDPNNTDSVFKISEDRLW